MHKMTEMGITYNIQTVYTYHEKDMPAGKTKVHIFSRKVSRNIWEYALSTPDFRSFLEAKSRECSDTISQMNQVLRNVVVTFHISFNGDTPFVGSAVCFFKTVSGGELRCRYNQSIQFEEILPGGKYLRDSSIEGMIQKERPENSVFWTLLFAVSLFSAFGISMVPFAFNLARSPLVPAGLTVIAALALLTVCLRYISRRRITRRMEIQDKRQEPIK
ncbi:hypothetical protein ACIXEQ_14355 [Bacteroides fragilis]